MSHIFATSRNGAEIAAGLAGVTHPEGIALRPVEWEDRDGLSSLPSGIGDTMPPAYGTRSPDEDGLAIVAVGPDGIAGHISCDLDLEPGRGSCDVDLWVSAIYTHPDHRGRGIGQALIEAAVMAAETWRRSLAVGDGLSIEGSVTPRGDAERGSGGEALLFHAAGICEELEDRSMDGSEPEMLQP